MLKRLVNEARFTLRLEAQGPLLVKAGASDPRVAGQAGASATGKAGEPHMVPVRMQRGGSLSYYLPGSSLKGVVRSHLEKIIRTLQPDAACDPFLRVSDPRVASATAPSRAITEASCGDKFDVRRRQAQHIDSAAAYGESCAVCRLFGSTSFASRVAFDDAVPAATVSIETERRDGVGIDRLTGGPFIGADHHGAKFTLEVISAGAAFVSDVLLRNFECWQLGALLLVLSDFEDTLIRVGSGRSRGLGAVRGALAAGTLTIHTIGPTVGKKAGEVWGLGRFLDDGSYGTSPNDVLTTSSLPPPPPPGRLGIRAASIYSGAALEELRAAAVEAFLARIDGWTVAQPMADQNLAHGPADQGRQDES